VSSVSREVLGQRRWAAKNPSIPSQASVTDSDSGPMPGDPQEGAQHAGAGFGVVEDGAAGAGIFLDVVGHARLVEGCAEPAGGTSKRRIAPTVAAHDRAGTGQRFVEMTR
jgi:hypothetical protein